MLVCEEKRIVSNVDRMAFDHLRAAGIIFTKSARPRVDKKVPKSRVGWKKLIPTGWYAGACDQCGKDHGTRQDWPYNMALCNACARVHTHSVQMGLKPSDDVRF